MMIHAHPVRDDLEPSPTIRLRQLVKGWHGPAKRDHRSTPFTRCPVQVASSHNPRPCSRSRFTRPVKGAVSRSPATPSGSGHQSRASARRVILVDSTRIQPRHQSRWSFRKLSGCDMSASSVTSLARRLRPDRRKGQNGAFGNPRRGWARTSSFLKDLRALRQNGRAISAGPAAPISRPPDRWIARQGPGDSLWPPACPPRDAWVRFESSAPGYRTHQTEAPASIAGSSSLGICVKQAPVLCAHPAQRGDGIVRAVVSGMVFAGNRACDPKAIARNRHHRIIPAIAPFGTSAARLCNGPTTLILKRRGCEWPRTGALLHSRTVQCGKRSG